MTATTIHSSISYDGDGVQTLFNIDFVFWDAADLKVYVRTKSGGARVLKVITTHYTIAGGDGATGTITMLTAPLGPASEELHIIRESNRQQNIDFTPSTKFPSASAEEGLDRAALRNQESFDAHAIRGLRMPQTDEAPTPGWPDMELPDKAARGVTGAYLAFNADGEPVIGTAAVPVASTSAFGDTWILLADRDAGRVELRTPENRGGTVATFQAALYSARGVPGVHGTGFFYATDKEQLSYSNGSAWVDCTIGHYTNALLPAAATDGVVLLDTDNDELLRDNGAALVPLQSPWPRGSIGGLRITYVAATHVTVTAGEARSIAGTASGRNLTLTSSITKTMAGADSWGAGTNNGNAPSSGRAINTVYYVFLIGKLDGSTDVALDVSPTGANIVAAGRIVTATYDDHIRYIGAIATNALNGGDIIPFDQFGDHFMPRVPFLNRNDSGTVDYTSGVSVPLSHVPANVLVDLVWTTSAFGAAGGELIFVATGQNGIGVPHTSNAPGSMGSVNNGIVQGRALIRVAGSSEFFVRSATDNALQLHLTCHGWWDDRGKND